MMKHRLTFITVGVVLIACSGHKEPLEGVWSGEMHCTCTGETILDDDFAGKTNFEFWTDGRYRTWMDPNVEGAWSMDGTYRIIGDTLHFKQAGMDVWMGARIVMMNIDRMIIEQSPEDGCICTSQLYHVMHP